MAALYKLISGSSASAYVTQLQLGGQFFTRKLGIGDDWTSVRVVLRCAFAVPKVTHPFNPGLMIGLTTDMRHYNDPNADCVGVWYDQTWTYTAGTTNQVAYTWSSTTPYNFHKVGTVFNSSAVGNNGARNFAVWPNLHCLGCNITRTATSFQVQQIGNLTGSTQTSVTRDRFFALAETPAGSSTEMYLETAATISAAYTGTGPLNSVMVWMRAHVPVLHICDLAVVRFS